MVKKTYSVKEMHCTSCEMLIEGELEDIGAKAVCSYHKQIVDVEYDTEKLSEKEIKQAIQRAGYQVTE